MPQGKGSDKDLEKLIKLVASPKFWIELDSGSRKELHDIVKAMYPTLKVAA